MPSLKSSRKPRRPRHTTKSYHNLLRSLEALSDLAAMSSSEQIASRQMDVWTKTIRFLIQSLKRAHQGKPSTATLVALTNQELSAILGSLRLLQTTSELPTFIEQIVCNGNLHSLPELEWIDTLCERLNCS